MIFVTKGLTFLVGTLVGFILSKLVSAKIIQTLQKAELMNMERIRTSELERILLADANSKIRQELLELTRDLSGMKSRQVCLDERIQNELSEKERYVKTIENQQSAIINLTVKVAELESEKKQSIQQLKSQQEHFNQILGHSKLEFENLANQILDVKSKKLSEQTTQSLDSILQPLKEKILIFEKSVDDKYSHEARERYALKSEIERLVGLNDRMTKEAQSLTQALKGDSKVMGDWGELVLEKILEASGLREGHEYSQQKSHENSEGERMRPDILINLPEGKHVIVDAKVSLKSYELHRRSEDAEIQTQTLEAHLKSIYKHIEDLGNKHYSKLKGVNSPELVFLFIPIEPAYLLAMQADADLSARAWKKGIAVVTATTLLISLKTVASLWRLENQNKNALEIAHESAKMYDKFVGLAEDLEKIGKVFDSGQTQFVSAMGKLKEGPGNVFRKMELLRQLGAAPNKRIPEIFLD